MKKKKYSGIIFGAIYGAIFRIIETDMDVFDFDGIIFLISIPIILSLIPVFYSTMSKIELFFYPFFSILIFFIFGTVSTLKTLLFTIIVGIPYFLIAGIIGVLVGGLKSDFK